MNKALFQHLVKLFNSGDTSEVADIFSKDYIDHQKPDWVKDDGPEEFVQIIKLARNTMPNLRVTIVGPLISDGDMIAGRLNWHSDDTERETIEILKLRGGKFCEHWGAKVWSKSKVKKIKS